MSDLRNISMSSQAEQDLLKVQDANKAALERGRTIQKDNSRLWGVVSRTKAKLGKVVLQQKQEEVGWC
jgi:hypothetical protein